MNAGNSINSRHFRLEQLAEGVYAAIHVDGGWAICNAGIIDLGDRTLIFDTFISPDAAEDLRDAEQELTGHPIQAVINSHYHNDHIWGNQVYHDGVDILSTDKTRDLIATEGQEEIRSFSEVAEQRLEMFEDKWKTADNEAARAEIRIMLDEFRAVVAALPRLRSRLPNVTFSGSMAFHGSKRSARLIPFEGGHCKSDAILHLPEDGIIFMGDILFVDCHPYLLEADPNAIHHILADIRKLSARIFVPGHGPVGNSTHLDWMDGYIDRLNDLAHEAIEKGLAEADLEKISTPVEYQHLVAPFFFPTNLKFLYHRQIDSSAD